MAKKKGSKDRSYELKKLKAECVAEENSRYIKSQNKRKLGSGEAPAGNTGLKATKSEVFIFLVGQEESTKNIQEQFKTTRSYKKTKSFTDAESAKNFLDVTKFPKNSIITMILVAPDFAKEEDIQSELDVIAKIKEEDPSLDVILLSASSIYTSVADFTVQKASDAFGKIVTNITWAIREQDRIRRQVESKQFIKIAIIVFFVFFILIFAIDFITGMMDTSPNPSGIFNILPIPHE
ncbi:MAG: hypothetical protein MJ198_01245 [Bacteroidales bacterium]|nr:hypothetical protein [Bacteroidales bacterium]